LFTKIPAHQWKTINHKYLKQNAVEYRNHLTIENKLKVKTGILFRKQAQLFLPPKKTLGVRDTRRDKHMKKLESNNYAGTLSWKVFITSHGHCK